MCMQAVLVVAQDLDDLAVRDCALGALRQHAFQFLLQGLTARNTVLDRDKLARGDDISSSASHVGLVRKTEQFPDVVQRKAEFTGVVDKGEPLLLRRSTIMVTRKPPLSSGRNPGIREDGQDRSRQVPRAGRGRSGGRAPARHCRDEFHAAGQEDAVGGWHRCSVQHRLCRWRSPVRHERQGAGYRPD